jgi:hypothetical protein
MFPAGWVKAAPDAGMEVMMSDSRSNSKSADDRGGEECWNSD